jgi:serine/threonine-protein kinase
MSDALTRLTAALADRYTIERELGAGGMATVYLAEDLKHQRKVAIKVLKPELAAVLGADRFVVEIKTTAALQHPHILPLFDSGEAIVPPMIDDRSSTIDHRSSSFLFYVMPYIQGETLRAKLDRETQFGIDEAVRITRDVADALDYAHRHGVVHRDIKPENILLHDGRPMVADFGIALALSAAAGGRMTETGMSLGTPHYMSPEQATADKEISGRSDIYSLGSVLYEMLTGNPPHTGSSAQQIIMKIIAENVEPVTKYRKSVPPNVAAAVAKSLEKLPADRFESAKAFAEALGNASFTTMHASSMSGRGVGGRSFKGAFIATAVVAAVALVAAGAGWRRTPPEEPFRRFDLAMGDVVPNPISDVVISPDGSTLAMVTVGSDPAIYLRRLDGDPEFRKLAGTETAFNPAFSPDGRWVVFRRGSDRSLVKISVSGGGAVTLVPGGKSDPYFPQWGTPDEIIYYNLADRSGYRVAASGGEATRMPKVTSAINFPLPDGSGLLHYVGGQVARYDFKTDSSVVLVAGGSAAVYVSSGHLLYVASEGGLFAVPFDLAKHTVTGGPVRVLERVGTSIISRGYAVSATGVLVQHDVAGTGSAAENHLVIVDPGKSPDTLRLPPARREQLRFSPEGRSLAMQVVVPEREGGNTDIYTLDLVSGTYTQLTFAGDNDQPVWSPDGKRLLFDARVVQGQEDLFIKPGDNSTPERRLTVLKGGELESAQWLGDTLLFVADGSGADVFIMKADSGSVPIPILQTPANETEPRVSPDRTLIAFRSDETAGSGQIWLRDFPAPQGKWNLSRGVGSAPRWSPDGRFVYYWKGAQPLDSLFRVRIDRTPSMVVQAPELVLAMDVDNIASWDLHPDGRRFIVTVPKLVGAPTAGAAGNRFLILQNFFGELRRVTAGKPK